MTLHWPEWWWPGFLIEVALFIALLLLLTWWLMRWCTRQVDALDAEIKALEAEMKAVEKIIHPPPDEFTTDEVW